MSIRAICTGCGCFLGEIREGKLHPKIKFICPKCETKRKASDLAKRTRTRTRTEKKDPFDGLFDNILKGWTK